VDKTLHAVERNRLLAAQALGYEPKSMPLDYGIKPPAGTSFPTAYVALVHATSRTDKLWPEEAWIALGQLFHKAGFVCRLPWGSAAEKQRSERLAASIPAAQVPGALTLSEAATLLAHAAVVVGVDTGLTHLAAALGTEVVAVYTGSSPGLTGVYGTKNAVNLGDQGRPPAPRDVWKAVSGFLGLH
jgi:heptosyltransferase-1